MRKFCYLILMLWYGAGASGAGLAVAKDVIDGTVSSPELMARLLRVEIIVENVRLGDSGGSVRVQAYMPVDLQILWDYIASCVSVFEYVDGLEACELVSVREEADADVSIVHQVVDKSWLIPRIDYTIEVRRQPLTRVDFKLVEGDLKAMEGGWRFVPANDGTGIVVTHEIRVQPSFPVPRWLVRRSMRNDIPDMLSCLRGLTADASLINRDSDLKHCPD
jgi:ribosome-associated toxin RatA of RatAB toxin-antitoxin module